MAPLAVSTAEFPEQIEAVFALSVGVVVTSMVNCETELQPEFSPVTV